MNGQSSTVTTTYGAEANFSCDKGFSLNGQAKKTCESNGVWSAGADATCTMKGLYTQNVLH